MLTYWTICIRIDCDQPETISQDILDEMQKKMTCYDAIAKTQREGRKRERKGIKSQESLKSILII